MLTLESAISLAQRALLVSLELALPLLAVALVIGLLASVFQTLTGIQEQTLSFALKILAVCGATLALLPWLLTVSTTYARSAFSQLLGMSAP